jgi:hypothetical protein
MPCDRSRAVDHAALPLDADRCGGRHEGPRHRPGNELSAWCVLEDGKPVAWGKLDNAAVLCKLREERDIAGLLAVEMIASYGMPVGREVFETCLWIGRFIEAWGRQYQLIYRKDVKVFHCESVRATDANIRASLIDGSARAR